MMKLMKSKDFLEKYRQVYATQNKIMGTALFFTRDIERIPQYISHVMFKNNIIYENNIFISIIKSDSPFGIETSFTKEPAKGLKILEIRAGYMEIVDVEKILKDQGIGEKNHLLRSRRYLYQ